MVLEIWEEDNDVMCQVADWGNNEGLATASQLFAAIVIKLVGEEEILLSSVNSLREDIERIEGQGNDEDN